MTKTVLAGIIRVKEVTDLNFAGDPLILFARKIFSESWSKSCRSFCLPLLLC